MDVRDKISHGFAPTVNGVRRGPQKYTQERVTKNVYSKNTENYSTFNRNFITNLKKYQMK